MVDSAKAKYNQIKLRKPTTSFALSESRENSIMINIFFDSASCYLLTELNKFMMPNINSEMLLISQEPIQCILEW